ncbi:MAG: hypothetical protein FWG65_13155 [Turicibacter sp.]|nr:hypothetical protein [Turicibacter sp.]
MRLSGIGGRLFGGGFSSNASLELDGHADGGIFDREHIARFAEGNQPEAIIPLSKPDRVREILCNVADFLGRGQPP